VSFLSLLYAIFMFEELIEGIEDLLEVARLSRLQAMDKRVAADTAHDRVIDKLDKSGDPSMVSKDHDAAMKKAADSVKSSEFAAKMQTGRSSKLQKQHSSDAEKMRGKEAGLFNVASRIRHGSR
jgi:hypothetical protein